MSDGDGDGAGILGRLRRRAGGGDGRDRPSSPPAAADLGPGGCEETDEISCREAVERLYEYLDGELAAEEAEEVRCHVERCKRCYPMFNWEQLFLDVIRESCDRPEGSPRLRRKVEAALARADG